jgi:tungstate transport system substrate-binding protein
MTHRFTSLRILATILLAALSAQACAQQARAQDQSIVVASTTSTQNSGLFGYLLPIVKQKTGIEVKVLAQGTGQALDTARRGDAMWCSFTPNQPKRSSSPKDMV